MPKKCIMGKTTIKNSMTWKLVGSATGTTAINLPTNWSELLIFAVDIGYKQTYTFNVAREAMDIIDTRPLVSGAYNSSAQYWMGVNVSTTTVQLSSATANGATDRKANTQTRVFYR